ncbi:MAG: helix-turn-helix transcriptional regulator, partial [Burkholderiaceae bacterium]
LINELEAQEPTPLAETVRRALRTMVMAGTASAANVARLFSMSERSLRRRLQADGTGIHELLAETRLEVARQLLQQTELPLSEIAATLHYSEASALSRAFRAWSGATPSEWRTASRKRKSR